MRSNVTRSSWSCCVFLASRRRHTRCALVTAVQTCALPISLLGQSVIVENKPGANATIAANYVAKAKPDGYTIFVTTNTSHSAAPWLMKNVAYDPIKDFTTIARGGNLPFLLVRKSVV